MSRFIRLVVATSLLSTFGLLTLPVFASPETDARTSIMARWEALVGQVLALVPIDPAEHPPTVVVVKDGDDQGPDQPDKPPIEPDEVTYLADPAG